MELKLYILDEFCAWACRNQENPTPKFTGICYWIFAGIFSPIKGDGTNDKQNNLTDVNIYTAGGIRSVAC